MDAESHGKLVLPVVHGEKACCTKLEDFGVRLGSFEALSGINLHIHCGEFTVIIGPNGAGKTTLLRAIMGEIPHTGTMSFVPSTTTPAGPRPRIGYVPQRFTIDRSAPLTVLEIFAAFRSRRPVWLGVSGKVREEAVESLTLAGAAELVDKMAGHLSCGQLQRVLLALALTPLPQILLLDEPLTGIDQAGINQFYELVDSLRHHIDLSIILVSHDIRASARIADRMVFLNERRVICEGPPAEVMAKREVRETFGLGDEKPGPHPVHCKGGLAANCPLNNNNGNGGEK